MKDDKRKRNIEKIETRKNNALNEYYRNEMRKLVGYISFVALICLLAFAAIGFIMFHIWNAMNPDTDYLYFIAIYCLIGSICNMGILAIAEEIVKKHMKRLGIEMKHHRRKIIRYYRYYLNEINPIDDDFEEEEE